MTLGIDDILLYAVALAALFVTPGPVWLAILARGVSGGFRATWPLALGVAVGDMVWPFLAILGVSALAGGTGLALDLMRWGGAALFVAIGIGLIRHAESGLTDNPALTRAGFWPGFAAGLLAILGNPKAIVFYLGLLPGLFDVGALTAADMAAIVLISAVVPLFGNLLLGAFLDAVRRQIDQPGRLARLNRISGVLMIGVGVLLVFF